MDIQEATKIATCHNLVNLVGSAFDFGYEQAVEKKGRFTQEELFKVLSFGGLRNFHRKAIWEAYKSGRFEAVTSCQINIKY